MTDCDFQHFKFSLWAIEIFGTKANILILRSQFVSLEIQCKLREMIERNEFWYSRHGLEAEGTLTTKIVQVKVILKITDINDSVWLFNILSFTLTSPQVVRAPTTIQLPVLYSLYRFWTLIRLNIILYRQTTFEGQIPAQLFVQSLRWVSHVTVSCC